ncbi:MAG: DNA alkylation repair protein [Phycisphaeraceae bacterium]|nr:DNA alkylation repair protein [Phycisphaeraceae bacterium]
MPTPLPTIKQLLADLESKGNEARRKHNTKNGAPSNQFGVKHGDIRAIAKGIKAKPDEKHALALELWKTGNVDAQFLACLLLNPKSLSASEIDTLTRATTFAHVADWFNSYIVAQHADKDTLRKKWMKEKAPHRNPWPARAGWHFTASAINKGTSQDDPEALLTRIEKELAKAKPEIQWTMNNTLAAIGIKHANLRKRAVAIGEKVGLYKDWPVSKGCIIPYVPVWVDAMVKRTK